MHEKVEVHEKEYVNLCSVAKVGRDINPSGTTVQTSYRVVDARI